jgi:ribosomal protein L35
MKTNKSLRKRIKISSKGKITKRPPNQGHFNAKASGNASRRKHGSISAPFELNDKVKALIMQ